MALIHVQLSGVDTWRGLVANVHYHLGCGDLASSTLADANVRRPVEVLEKALASNMREMSRTAVLLAGEAVRYSAAYP